MIEKKLKDLWYDIYTCYDILEGTSKNDNKEMSQEYLAKKLAALDQAHSAQPYDHVIRRLMVEKNVDPKISEKWRHYFDVEERFALKMQKKFSEAIEVDRLPGGNGSSKVRL